MLWLNQDDHAEQLAHDLYGTDHPELHDIIAEAAAGLRATLNTDPGAKSNRPPGAK